MWAYAEALLFSLYGPLEVACVLAVIAFLLARRDHGVLASAFVIASFVSLKYWSIISSAPGAIPFAAIALIIGSVVWAAPYWTGNADEGNGS